MEVKAQDIIDSVDLSKSEALYPIYESVVNSIISLLRAGRKGGKIDVFIEREDVEDWTGGTGTCFTNNRSQ